MIACGLAQDSADVEPLNVDEKVMFQQRNFGKYFISDMYAPINSVRLGLGLNLREYNISTNRSAVYVPYNETTLGVELPIYQSTTTNKTGKQSKFSVSIPISANI